MARRITRKELLKPDEVQEAAFELGHWLEENWRTVAAGAGAVAVVGALLGGWLWYGQRQAVEAQALLAQAQGVFARAETNAFIDDGELAAALDAYDQVIDATGNRQPGQVAHYYRAIVLHRLGRDEDAIRDLEVVISRQSNPPTLRGSAENFLADLYVGTDQVDRAIDMLRACSEDGESGLPPSVALVKLGRVYLKQGETQQARDAWQRVLDEYPQQPVATEARQLLGS
jgi:predicted negative regulator of RcsB-dependent stress response